MTKPLFIHNSLTRKKEIFESITPGFVGMYSCGPTVYNDVHLGNCRTFISFDIVFRYLTYLGYKVRYVRNITDVGHLLDDGEDRMSKGARLEKLEPMEVAEKYTNGFHDMMRIFNVLPPSIEPRATGHIPEQIEMVQEILKNGLGYERNGSVYFDVPKFIEKYDGMYGQLSGRIVEDLFQETRELKNQDEKNHPADFAIWMKAGDDHIMKWNSPWSVGFPGWHLECSAMSTKYLGETFDIHGGGGDLKFPHHENEIAQNIGSCGHAPAKYWIHGNMLLMNGKKMSKSDGNTIMPLQLFSGESEHISKGYSPMTVRFFMLQAHYGSTLDITDEGLQAAEKGYKRMMEAYRNASSLNWSGPEINGTKDSEISSALDAASEAMNDDFSTPRAIASLFELVSIVNKMKDGHLMPDEISQKALIELKAGFEDYLFKIFGLKDDHSEGSDSDMVVSGLMNLILDLRQEARVSKNWGTSDKIRDTLAALDIQVKDSKDGSSWIKN
jgi:cysteinyl-tRNA synthetase